MTATPSVPNPPQPHGADTDRHSLINEATSRHEDLAEGVAALVAGATGVLQTGGTHAAAMVAMQRAADKLWSLDPAVASRTLAFALVSLAVAEVDPRDTEPPSSAGGPSIAQRHRAGDHLNCDPRICLQSGLALREAPPGFASAAAYLMTPGVVDGPWLYTDGLWRDADSNVVDEPEWAATRRLAAAASTEQKDDQR